MNFRCPIKASCEKCSLALVKPAIYIILVQLLLVATLFGQQSKSSYPRNSFDIELLGVGGLYSFNYAYRFHEYFSARFGLTAWRIDGMFGGGTDLIGLPVMINTLLGDGTHFLEAGVGFVINSTTEQAGSLFGDTMPTHHSSHPYYIGSIGYRHEKKKGGFMFRIAFTPILNYGFEKATIPIGGISFGVTH
jgi:hypothetical protein